MVNPILSFSFSICQIRDRKCIIVGTSSGLGDKYLIIPSLSPCQYHTSIASKNLFPGKVSHETQQKMFRLWMSSKATLLTAGGLVFVFNIKEVFSLVEFREVFVLNIWQVKVSHDWNKNQVNLCFFEQMTMTVEAQIG